MKTIMKTFLRECRWVIVFKLLYLLIKSTPMDSDEGLKLHRMIDDFLEFFIERRLARMK